MAGTARQASDPLALDAALRAAPGAFEFFDALRRIECAFAAQARLGRSSRAADDPVRLCHAPSLAFAPRMLDRYEPGGPGHPPRLHGLFLGLFGPHGPLPLHLTEYALERERQAGDSTLVAFADIFHHRMLSLFYRAWADAQPTVQHDRPGEAGFRLYLGTLAGLAMPSLRDRDALPDEVRCHFAGRWWHQARNREGLRGVLEHFFRIPVAVVEFMAEWMRLPADGRLRLGKTAGAMGQTTVLGSRVRGCQQSFRLRLGPLDRVQFQRFLPGGVALRQLAAATRSYVGDEQAWDVQLVLRKTEVPAVQLGRHGSMGWTAWLGGSRPDVDAEDVILQATG